MKKLFIIFFIIFHVARAQNSYRICAPEEISDFTCNSLNKGGGLVKCTRVTDGADCAIKLKEGKADFGIFDAEELMLTYQFYPNDFTPVAQLRHTDRLKEEYQFQTVAVVSAKYNANEGVTGLKKTGLCHPGFSQNQMWNDYILKYLERRTYDYICRADLSVRENEAENIKNFFGAACRPGEWALLQSENKKLKDKYPELCSLCDNKEQCTYHNSIHHGHMGALECLTSGRGGVAYVAYEYVHQYFNINSSNPSPLDSEFSLAQPGFQFLCPNGALQPLTTSKPCGWIQQPWGLILARNEIANDIIRDLQQWLPDTRRPSDAWLIALNDIIQKDSKAIYFPEIPSLRSYLVSGREVDLPSVSCGNSIRWCTLNSAETNKCNWVAKEAALLGIEPRFSCIERNSTIDCFRDIKENRSDIIVIDSNYGHLARQKYNLSTILYTETSDDRNSKVIAIVRENSGNKIQSFKEIRGKYLCFPDYGGISWLSFINVARFHKIIPDTCNYAEAVAKLSTAACTPGIRDENYSDVTGSAKEILDTLCNICPIEVDNNSTCSAGKQNEYFGDKGVLKCLAGPGDIGFIEAKNLRGYINRKVINESDYRVLCRNGSLAINTGFDVDNNCALSITIDSEIMGRRANSEIETADTKFALLKIEDWLGYRPLSRRAIRVYDSFTDEHDLLFKDSTVGLETTDSNIKSILAYKELFKKIESCNSSSSGMLSNFRTIFIILFIAVLFN